MKQVGVIELSGSDIEMVNGGFPPAVGVGLGAIGALYKVRKAGD